jgi:cyanophycin synthetase
MSTPAAADAPPFDFSRRLTGPNLFFTVPGAVLDVPAAWPVDAAREADWRARVLDACSALHWPMPQLAVRRHAAGVSLALSAPVDQLLAATSVNEWAWMDALGLPWTPDGPGGPAEDGDDEPSPQPEPIADRNTAFATLADASRSERSPALVALIDATRRHRLPVVMDDTDFTIGSGSGAYTWPLAALPAPPDVPWPTCHAVPTALITGTNGKTTTVRLLAAIAAEAGLRSGHSSTAGLFVDRQCVHPGDYSGPAGARAILRDPRVEIAVLETARGGMLRRGLALDRVDAAIVTNLSADHFGEYGITDLQGLADAKLIVAHAIDEHGLLVLNADDPVLRERGPRLRAPLAWFAQDDDDPLLAAHRDRGHATCGLRVTHGVTSSGTHMHLRHPARGIDADLGDVAAMPLTLRGHARYNVANLMGAALVATALKLPLAALIATFARFGAQHTDNPGRLQTWQRPGGITVWLDYAHNPDGLRGLLAAATAHRPTRLILVLGQAGNRADAEIRDLAAAAASFHPAHVVLKDIAGMERGRAPGEVAAILRKALIEGGVPAQAITFHSLEADAARAALAAAREGDGVVLPIHGPAALAEVAAWLDATTAAA